MFRNIVLAALVSLSVGCASARIATPVAEAVVPEMPAEPMKQEAVVPAEPLALNEEASEVPVEPMPVLREYSDELYESFSPVVHKSAGASSEVSPEAVPISKKESDGKTTGMTMRMQGNGSPSELASTAFLEGTETTPQTALQIELGMRAAPAQPNATGSVVAVDNVPSVQKQSILPQTAVFVFFVMVVVLALDFLRKKQVREREATVHRLHNEKDELLRKLRERHMVSYADTGRRIALERENAELRQTVAYMEERNSTLLRELAEAKSPPPKVKLKRPRKLVAAEKPDKKPEETRSSHKKSKDEVVH